MSNFVTDFNNSNTPLPKDRLFTQNQISVILFNVNLN